MEAKLNALPQFKTEIDGVDIHFIQVKSAHDDALPLIITHGWPGSVIEARGRVRRGPDARLHRRDGRAPPNDRVPPRGFTARPGGLDAGPRPDSYEKISHAFVDGQPSGNLTRDHILDNITLYWLTNTATSAARLYWEFAQGATALVKDPPPHVSLPVAFTVFPGAIFQAPRHWVKQAYHILIYYNEADRGGHFAAWEEPELFAGEMRAAFKSLR